MKPMLLRILKLTGALLLLAVIALGCVYAYVHTAPGRQWLARLASMAASDPAAGLTVTVEGLEGTLPGDIRIRTLSLGDAQGEYATLAGVHLRWKAAALWHKRIHITALEAESIRVLRAPSLPPSSPPEKPAPFRLPELPGIAIDRLHLPSVWVGAALAGSDRRFAVEGGGTPADWQFELKTLEGPPTTLDIRLSLLPDSLRAHMQLDEAPGGLLLHLLKQNGTEPLHIGLEADTDASGLLHLRGLTLTSGPVSLQGQGEYNLKDRRSDLRLSMNVADAAAFSALAGMPLEGSVTATLAANGPPEALAFALDASVKDFMAGNTWVPEGKTSATGTLNIPETSVRLKDELSATVNGEPVTLALEAALQDTLLTVSRFDGAYGPYRAKGTLEADHRSRRFKAAVTSPLPPLAVVAPQLHLEASGETAMEAEGTFDAFTLHLKTNAASKEGDAALVAKGDVDLAERRFNGTLDMKATRSGQHFTLALPVKADPSEITIEHAALKGPGIELAANLHWLVAQQLGDGTLTLHASDLRPLGVLTGQTLAGQAQADIALASHNRTQSASATLDARNIAINGITLTQATLTGDAQDIFGRLQLNAKLAAGPLTAGTTRLATLAFDASGVPSQSMVAALDASGSADGQPFSVALRGNTHRDSHPPQVLRITLSTFTGLYKDAPITLAKPAEIGIGKDTVTLSPLLLTIAGGDVVIEGKKTPSTVSAQMDIQHLRIDKLPVPGMPQGTVEAKANLQGTPSAPELTLNSTASLMERRQPVQTHVTADWRGGRLHVKGDAAANGSTLHADVAIAAPLSLSPFVMGVHGGSSLQGTMVVDAALESLNPFLRTSGQRVSGKLAGSVTLAGTLAAPDVQGRLLLSNGQYAHDDTGICVRGMQGEIEGNGHHLVLKQLEATSPQNGTLHADAAMTLTGAKPIQGKVSLRNYRLFCGGMASGSIEGDLALAGTADAARLNGTLTFPRLDVELPGNSAGKTTIPTVETVYPASNARGTGKPSAPPGTGSAPLQLGVNIHVPGQMFIRGRGLDAEFKGDLAIQGPADNPSVVGLFESKRGRFDLLDKTLKLVSAEVRFEGAIPPSPFLDIKAESVTKEYTIDVNLSGPAAKPTLAMQSTPPLSQDEILAQLLFGRELSSLGVFQIAQLAQATATLAGYNSGPDVVGKVRSFLGVDTLDVGTDSNNDVSVGAGKYITDKVYVGMTQGAKPESRGVTMEVDVYPHVSATTGVTANGQQNVGVQWKYDY